MNLRGTRFLQLILSFFLASALFFISTCPILAKTIVEVKTEVLNVRSGPDISFDKIGQVNLGERYLVMEEENGWLKINFTGESAGWVSDRYVGRLQEEQTGAQDEPKPKKEIIVTGNQVNVRSGPDTSFSKIDSLGKGVRLPLILHENGWYQVELSSGNIGWIADWLAEPVSAQEAPPDSEPPALGTEKSTVIATPSTLNVRSGPSLDAERIGAVTQGTRMSLVSRSGDWYQVEMADKRKGWVAGWLVQFPGTALSSWKYQPSQVAVIQRVGESKEVRHYLAGKTIVVDPGHGSIQPGGWTDPGAIGSGGLWESDAVLEIGKKLRNLLEKEDARVIMTRTGDTNLSLEGRARVANEISADVFVSIHANSSPGSSINGTSTYFYAPLGSELGSQREMRKKLAECVQEKLLQYAGRANLGVREENFAVLRSTTVPSILVETAFISHPEEEMLLRDTEFRNKLALGIMEGLAQYFQDTR
ncbi:MAG: N-acetylmuramoyl-L-alanine amidase [Bacillota bacterium]|jgi:N-acetylmuramoyl-L-alanine amidase